MTPSTILLLISAFAIAFLVVYFHYFYKIKTRSNTILFLAFFRFCTVFGILVVLINPIFTFTSFLEEKTPLPIVVDNSSSINTLNASELVKSTYQKLLDNPKLRSKYEVQLYQFDKKVTRANQINFNGKQTNIDVVATTFKSSFRNKTYPIVLLSDGNQTTGRDYAFSFAENTAVNPIIIGDTVTYPDLRIDQINTNKYAFLSNTFPVEIFLNYNGKKSVEAELQILQGNRIINKQKVLFSATNKSRIQTVLLPATAIGLQVYNVILVSKTKEKNNYNNQKKFAVEVIDQKSEIGLFSAINHPDVGSLKRAIETNMQRKVTVLSPNEIANLEKFTVLIYYQPTVAFKALFSKANSLGLNAFVITGMSTDFTFLNQNQSFFEFKMSSQKEDFFADFNSDFNLFEMENFGFENFPPLQNPFGTCVEKGTYSSLLFSRIRTIATKSPLLVFIENQNQRTAFLMGENSWKWRLQSNVQNQTFNKYDRFIDKIIQFLNSDASRKNLLVTHENFYYSNDNIIIKAQYFNKNYEFDSKAQLSITLQNKETKEIKKYDLLKESTNFKVTLDGLASGKYSFKVEELGSKKYYNGSFEIVEFDIERQFTTPNVSKLTQLAYQTKGQVYMPNQTDELISKLLANQKYNPTQKEVTKKVPLIDFKLLLTALLLFLAIEWLVRKYNGLL